MDTRVEEKNWEPSKKYSLMPEIFSKTTIKTMQKITQNLNFILLLNRHKIAFVTPLWFIDFFSNFPERYLSPGRENVATR